MTVGLAVGKIQFFGLALGPAAALFVSLGLSAANPDITIPAFVFQLGLAMFVYIIGLNFGPTFVREFRTRGWRLSLFTLVVLACTVGIVVALVRLLDLDPLVGTGMFAGSLTSTPAMAAVVDLTGDTTPVVGYSLAYPGGVLGVILLAAIGAAVLKVDHDKDAGDEGLVPDPLVWKAVHLDRDPGGTASELPLITGEHIVATRLVDDPEHHQLLAPTTPLRAGSTIIINGTESAVDAAIAALGTEVEMTLSESQGLDYARITVSSPDVAGKCVRELDTLGHGFLIARVRSGDHDRVPTPDTTINYSDRVRVIADPHNMHRVRAYLGDSESALGHTDLLPLALGLLAGLGLGAIPIPLPGDSTLTLGFGGGPIIMGLFLGWVTRTGPIHWQLPYHTKHTIATLGLILFLAGVGTSAGAAFAAALTDPTSLRYIAGGLITTLSAAVLVTFFGLQVFRLRWDEAMGVIAGLTTNPAVIAYLNGQTGTDLANRGYATVYPAAMIGKILAAQILVVLLV